MKRKIEEDMEIVWQTPANPPERHDYIFLNGIRYVRPYYFEFISHVKNRWAGKTIVHLFTEEFKGRSRDYYVSAVKAGRIQVDGRSVSVSYVVQSSQKISHFLHRHEPPVMALAVEILQKEADVLTICKPASVPVHPCGQYRKNTVVGILQAEHDLTPLFRILLFFMAAMSSLTSSLRPSVRLYVGDISSTSTAVHRLDRLVSGLLILARNASKADLFRQQIEAGDVKKQYIARVIGVFPEDEQIVDVNVNYNAREGKSTLELEDNCENRKTALKGKSACTKFTRISTNGTESVVLCEPITGRTHQIRVHLQHTGHPIANDLLYLSTSNIGRSAVGLTADKAAALLSLSLEHNNQVENPVDKPDDSSKEHFHIDPMCTNCPNLAPKGYDGDEAGLWLHCFKYSGPGWTYECPCPDWACLE